MRKKKVLIVDDHRDFLQVSGAWVQILGFGVLLASGAAEALEIVKAEEVDILLVDVLMPGTDGIQLAAELGALVPHLPLALMSIMPRKYLEEKLGKDLGSYQFVEKIAEGEKLRAFLQAGDAGSASSVALDATE